MIVVFDAKCLLCNGSVQFLLRHDTEGVFQFASIQGATGSALLTKASLSADELQTMLLIDGDHVWQQTAAVIRIAHALGWPWRSAWVLWLIPAPLRDAVYRLVARNRYRLFGRSETCLIPPRNHAARFLD